MTGQSRLLSVVVFVVAGGVFYLLAAIGTVDGLLMLDMGWPRLLWDTNGDELSRRIMLELQLPRLLAAFVVGSGLAVSGLLLQKITRNPLADPFLLGVSGGAALAVVGVHAIPGMVSGVGGWIVPVAAFLGAQLATFAVLLIGGRSGGRLSVVGLVLAGVIVNAFCVAFSTFLLMQFEPLKMKVTSLWMAGEIGYFGWNRLVFSGGIIALATIGSHFLAKSLNAIALGEEGAVALGIDVRRTLIRTTWLSSLLAGVAVSLGGLIGYVGLLVPHMIRMVFGWDLPRVLIVTAVSGGVLLMGADGASRLILAPREVPVGVLTALLGTPVLLVLLSRQLGGR